MSHPGLSILIPAAGASTRLGQPKQLVQYKGQSLILRAVEQAESLAPAEIIVVTGADAEAVAMELQQSAARCVYNPDWEAGMGTSIAAGVKTVNVHSSGLMILLCDQWRLRARDLHRLAVSWQTNPGRIVCAAVNDRHAPPVIFPLACFAALTKLKGDGGAHSVLHANTGLITSVAMDNAGPDLDTPAQLDALNSTQRR